MTQPDGKAYYGYLFEENKKPTKIFDALLRGIANYIIECIGDKEARCLSPPKLAAFYKAVGGNYDSLFVDVPHPSISYIFQRLGCQHTLQYTSDDFAPPSIPALTPRGFARWEAIETLLGPEEHVPFLQAAVRNFTILHPETGERFPVDLPTESFPPEADPVITKWHTECGQRLRQEVSPEEKDLPYSKPNLPPRPNIRSGYSHLRNPISPGRSSREQGADYFSSRPLRFQHVPASDTARLNKSRDSNYRPHLHPTDGSPESPRLRRRSFPENYYSSPKVTPSPATAEPTIPHTGPEHHARRHSHSQRRHDRSTSSSTSDTDTEPRSSNASSSPHSTNGMRTPRSHAEKEQRPNIRFSVPQSPITNSYPPSPHPHRRNLSVPHSRERPENAKFPADIPIRMFSTRSSRGDHGARGGTVRWGPVDEAREFIRRGSWDDMAATVEDDVDDDSRIRERDSRRRRDDGRPRLVQARSGSHDGRYLSRGDAELRRDRDRDREKERYSDKDEKELAERRRDRDRKRGPSPVKGLDWRRYVPDILR